MRLQALLLAGTAALGVLGAGSTVASAWNDVPQDAQPAPAQDQASPSTADLNRQELERNQQEIDAARRAAEGAPNTTPAPAAPIAITIPGPTIEPSAEAIEKEALLTPPAEETLPPERRARMRVAVVEAVDKVTAERMRFEVPVGGRPVRFDGSLLFSAKACDLSARDERDRDAIAYMEIAIQPRGVLQASEPRQIFRGWMFASTPSVSGPQHPVYDAWIVGCKA